MKPRLPDTIELLFPLVVLRNIYRYVPNLPPKPAMPGLQRELTRLQSSPKQTAMYLKGLEDFILR